MANTDPWIYQSYQSWDRVPRMSKHPLLTGYTRHELKAQVSFSDRLLSVVCLSDCPSVYFSYFGRLLKNH